MTSEAPSFSKVYERAPSNNYDTEPGSFNVSAPSLSKTGMRNNESQITITEAFEEKGMSISDMKHGGVSANGESGLHQSDGPNSVVQAPGISNQGHAIYSDPDQGDSYNADQKPAGISNQARPNNSESAQTDDDPEDDDAGMSMVGKKYKEVNPTAYYVEK